MADFDEVAIPLGPRGRRMLAQQRARVRVRQQRRMSPDGMREPEMLGGTGRANDSGRSELDTEEQRRRLRELAADVTQAAGEGLGNTSPAAPQAPITPPQGALPANPFGQGTPAHQADAAPIAPLGLPQAHPLDDEDIQVGRVNAALGRLAPEQLRGVQALPVVGDEDSDENAEMLIGAASRAQGLPPAPSTQLRAPMSGTQPTSSARLRAPMVMDDVAPPDESFMPDEDEDVEMLGARPDASVRRSVGGGDDLAMLGRNLYAQQDAQDRAESERIADQRRRAQIAATVVGLFGQGQDVAQAMTAPYDPQAPFARRSEQRMNEFEQAMAEREAELEERRIAQGEAAVQQRAGYRDADILPDHPNAENERRLYAASFAALPEHIRRTFPGFDPSNPSVRDAQSQLGAAQIRRQLELLNEQVGVRFPDEADWRSSVRTGGGRAPRGQLAGFTQPGRTIHRGDSGVTPEQLMQMDAAGVDELPEQPMAPPVQRGGAPSGRGGAPAPRAPHQVAPERPARAGSDWQTRNPSPQEFAELPIDVQTTVSAARAVQRRHIGMPWNEAMAAANGMTPEQRGQEIREWGSDATVLVPGWRRVQDTGAMSPARMSEIRSYAQQARTAAALSSEILGLIDQVNTLDLAEGALRGHPLVQEMLGKARRLQTLLRVVDRTGVPTGDEQARAMQEAPEPLDPIQVLRARSAYEAYPRSILSITYRNMQGEGFLPERPRARTPQGGR